MSFRFVFSKKGVFPGFAGLRLVHEILFFSRCFLFSGTCISWNGWFLFGNMLAGMYPYPCRGMRLSKMIKM
ncbi:hypothetical protein MSLAZ_3039 [Methanosarcina lacustris Z-7289]|uniref:Uncharacterized protein n=1 Tax=Methanosarcina lacustris Z-7289 TaxID=1434111 RepID=A0A0E3WUK1_9EURY|nr:hypothetical protein MSLAZ_3039 [Methanosarcina lacustris Z-7289]